MVHPKTSLLENRTGMFLVGVARLPPVDLVRETTVARVVLAVEMIAQTGVVIVNVSVPMAKVLTVRMLAVFLAEIALGVSEAAGREIPPEILIETRKANERRSETGMEIEIARTKKETANVKGIEIEATGRRTEIAIENETAETDIVEMTGIGRTPLARVLLQLLLMTRHDLKLLAIELEVLLMVKKGWARGVALLMTT